MIKIENVVSTGFEAAVRGMRNPMNSWYLSDSRWIDVDGEPTMIDGLGVECTRFGTHVYTLGPADLKLMKTLFEGGPTHRKYLRMIHITMDITAPLYWWKEFDTYKIATTSNSCSTMHKIAAKPFEMEDFSVEWLDHRDSINLMHNTISLLNSYRGLYIETKDKHNWWQMIQLLPSSYNQKRTIDMSYETVFQIIRWRESHKLDEWRWLVKELKELPLVHYLLREEVK